MKKIPLTAPIRDVELSNSALKLSGEKYIEPIITSMQNTARLPFIAITNEYAHFLHLSTPYIAEIRSANSKELYVAISYNDLAITSSCQKLSLILEYNVKAISTINNRCQITEAFIVCDPAYNA